MDKNYADPDIDDRYAFRLDAVGMVALPDEVASEAGRQDDAVVGPQGRPEQADNNEGGLPPLLHQAVLRGEQCCARVPERIVSDETARRYKKTFVRMWASGSLAPLRPGMAYDSYYERRAALHYGAVNAIRKLIKRALGAYEQQDYLVTANMIHKLHQLLDQVEPALDVDPPGNPNFLPWEGSPSRFHELADDATPERGANSKKHALAKLDKEWDRILWKKARELKFEHLLVLAVSLTVPVRLEDAVPGERPSGYSHGVLLNLIGPNHLEITVKPCKSHGGQYGTESTTIIMDPIIAEAPAKFLAQCCHEAGGRLVVGVISKNAVRKAIRVLGEKVFGKGSETITPSVLRHQIIADLKVIFGGGEKVAAASGHSTDRTQSKYGFHQHGRHRKGYEAITSARIPRTGNVVRASQISNSKVSYRKE
jgi:hypothetical protein